MFRILIKKILLVIICFAISFPSNAAISVSDGSAFVTKAEFSADLNNLSNRMAQLENSLDAKIDSLVSSYLTRNGIWNGSKQTLLTNSFVFESPINYGAMGYEPVNLSLDGAFHNLFRSTKSGLAFVDLYWKGTYAGNYCFWGYRAVPINTSRNKNVSDDSIFISLYFYDENDNILTALQLSNGKGAMQGFSTGNVNQSFMICAPVPLTSVNLITQFFVSKDELYKVRFRAFVLTGYSDGTTAITPNSGGATVWFTGATVY